MSLKKVILASASTERFSMLKEILDISVSPADVDETPMTHENASQLVERLAILKAKARMRKPLHIISADTIIDFDGQILGKPLDRKDARNTLLKIMNHTFKVWTTTVFYIGSEDLKFKTDCASLKCKTLTDSELNQYLDSNIWVGKAGSFSINDKSCPVNIINGEYDIVRGVSLSFINEILCKLLP
jgi:septum formation protein